MKRLVEPIPYFEKHERFLKFIRVDLNTNCWNWIGHINKEGYGKFNLAKNCGKRESFTVSRISYSIFNKTDPLLLIDHTCRNRKCVNPEHLQQASPLTNTHENSVSTAHFLSLRSCCNKGHEYTEENTAIRKNNGAYGGRRCKTCEKERQKRRYLKQRSTH